VFVIRCKKGESVVIGDDIILTVIEVRGDTVRLGFGPVRSCRRASLPGRAVGP